MDVIEILFREGFSFRSFPAYPRHIGVEKYNCAALLESTPEGGWRQFSSAGALLEDGEIALLVERRGQSLFVYKSKELPAEGELMENYRRFLQELRTVFDEAIREPPPPPLDGS